MLPDKINPACGEAPSLFVDDLSRLRELFAHLEGELPPWRISYRQICGAPLEAEFMAHGWTSHLSLWDTAGSVEHKVDIFSKPTRVSSEELSADAEGWASQHVVAQMKKTDRDRDWPIVNGLGQQLWEEHRAEGLLHITDANLLVGAWQAAAPEVREQMAARHPLLRALATAFEQFIGTPAWTAVLSRRTEPVAFM